MRRVDDMAQRNDAKKGEHRGRTHEVGGLRSASSPPPHPALATAFCSCALSVHPLLYTHYTVYTTVAISAAPSPPPPPSQQAPPRSLHLPLPWPPLPPHAVVNDDHNERLCPAPSIAHAPPLPTSLAISTVARHISTVAISAATTPRLEHHDATRPRGTPTSLSSPHSHTIPSARTTELQCLQILRRGDANVLISPHFVNTSDRRTGLGPNLASRSDGTKPTAFQDYKSGQREFSDEEYVTRRDEAKMRSTESPHRSRFRLAMIG
ncbi:hypothetical protein BDN70DRAFT_489775 [Pholiota conissans]|uniref:Uncharacterized protein n=1 Tax=Pholiota conissans TaxID=109636 RepID=A0A9P5YPH1_9AGAR|nr:hypothetical protein BDN70DRAFT_489775 [Pholiota conissans]